MTIIKKTLKLIFFFVVLAAVSIGYRLFGGSKSAKSGPFWHEAEADAPACAGTTGTDFGGTTGTIGCADGEGGTAGSGGCDGSGGGGGK